jgi:molybdopterin-guanine dinucleotide biosynthesis protein A
VGPDRPELPAFAGALPDGLAVVREDPPGCGPVPALRAGLAGIGAPWVLVLAADLPFLHDEHIRELLAIARRDRPAGVIMADDAGAAQWLTGCWQAARLRAALAGYDGSSLRGLFGPLNPVLVRCLAASGAPPPWLDCDTPADLAAARDLAAGAGRAAEGDSDSGTTDSERQERDHA